MGIRNGFETLHTARGYDAADLGERIRVVWSVAEYRGRGRFGGATIKRIEKINAFNHERRLEQQGSNIVVLDAITTGNFGGFDAWFDPTAPGELEVVTNLAARAPSLRIPSPGAEHDAQPHHPASGPVRAHRR